MIDESRFSSAENGSMQFWISNWLVKKAAAGQLHRKRKPDCRVKIVIGFLAMPSFAPWAESSHPIIPCRADSVDWIFDVLRSRMPLRVSELRAIRTKSSDDLVAFRKPRGPKEFL